MARANSVQESGVRRSTTELEVDDDDGEDLYGEPHPRKNARRSSKHRSSRGDSIGEISEEESEEDDNESQAGRQTSNSTSPAASSDKENPTPQRRNNDPKGKGRVSELRDSMGTKRKRTSSGGALREKSSTQAAVDQILEDEGDKDKYDPEQDPQERRQMRRTYRELERKTNDLSAELVRADDETKLLELIEAADDNFTNVKQTHDATIDARLFLQLGNLTLKRAKNAQFGESAAIIDIDDVVLRVQKLMMPDGPSNEEEESVELDWGHFGRTVGFPSMFRPATSSFMLGPLAAQKKARKQAVRKERLAAHRPDQLVRPEELLAKDIQKSETSTHAVTVKVFKQYRQWEMQHGKGQNLFKFIINPESFSQTVENMFYMSFLVRDGHIAIQEDEDGLPIICSTNGPATEQYKKANNLQKKQLVFTMTMQHWKDCIDVFDIKESAIPTRACEAAPTGNGWYG